MALLHKLVFEQNGCCEERFVRQSNPECMHYNDFWRRCG